jgi:ribosomal protein S9
MINGKNYQDYVGRPDLFQVLLSPLKLVSGENKYYFEVKVEGS